MENVYDDIFDVFTAGVDDTDRLALELWAVADRPDSEVILISIVGEVLILRGNDQFEWMDGRPSPRPEPGISWLRLSPISNPRIVNF